MTPQFTKGDYVEMTPEAIKEKLHWPKSVKTGVVVSTRKLSLGYIMVRRTGYQSIERYHKSFWKLIRE